MRTDAQGRFKLESVPPGNYVAFSWETVEPTAWLNAEFMKDYEQFGQPVRIEADGRSIVQIKAIPDR